MELHINTIYRLRDMGMALEYTEKLEHLLKNQKTAIYIEITAFHFTEPPGHPLDEDLEVQYSSISSAVLPGILPAMSVHLLPQNNKKQ